MAGSVVVCPTCGQQFAVSGQALIRPEPPVVAPRNTLVVQQRQKIKRDNANWFGVGFGIAAGVLTACAIAGGVAYWVVVSKASSVVSNVRQAVDKVASDREQLTKEAKAAILPSLTRYGIVALSDDVKFDGTTLIGPARNSTGKLRFLMVKLVRARFGNDVQWKIVSITMDGERVYEAED